MFLYEHISNVFLIFATHHHSKLGTYFYIHLNRAGALFRYLKVILPEIIEPDPVLDDIVNPDQYPAGNGGKLNESANQTVADFVRAVLGDPS